VAHTSLKLDRVQDPDLQEIIATNRKQLYKRMQDLWKRVCIIMEKNRDELDQLISVIAISISTHSRKISILLEENAKALEEIGTLIEIAPWIEIPTSKYLEERLPDIFENLIQYRKSIDSKEDVKYYEKIIDAIISFIETKELHKNINKDFPQVESRWVAKRHEHAGHIVEYQKRIIYKQEGKVRTYRINIQNKTLELETLDMIPWDKQSTYVEYGWRWSYPVVHLEDTN